MLEICRRDLVINSVAACAAFGFLKPVSFIGAAHAQDAPYEGFRKYKVNDIEVFALGDGVFERSTTRGVFGPKAHALARSMAAAGIQPQSVKTIVISHFHADHISGLMNTANESLFPEAEILVPSEELKWWTQQPIDQIAALPSRRGLVERIRATLGTWENVRPVDGEADIAPGLRTVPAYGHTKGHTALRVSSGTQQMLLTGDISLLPALFAKNLGWKANFFGDKWDLDQVMAEETRRRIFEQAVTDRIVVAGYHWGLPNVGTIARDGNGYAFEPSAGL